MFCGGTCTSQLTGHQSNNFDTINSYTAENTGVLDYQLIKVFFYIHISFFFSSFKSLTDFRYCLLPVLYFYPYFSDRVLCGFWVNLKRFRGVSVPRAALFRNHTGHKRNYKEVQVKTFY